MADGKVFAKQLSKSQIQCLFLIENLSFRRKTTLFYLPYYHFLPSTCDSALASPLFVLAYSGCP